MGLVALIITSSLAGLALGAPAGSTGRFGSLPERDALLLGVAVGAFGAALLALAGSLRTPAWADRAAIAPLGAVVPVLAMALEPLAGFLTRAAVLLSLLVNVSHATLGWTRRRAARGSGRGAGGIPRRGRTGRSGARRVGRRRHRAGCRTARRVCDRPARRSDDDPDRARHDDGARRADARSASVRFPERSQARSSPHVLTALLAWWLFRALRRWRAGLAS